MLSCWIMKNIFFYSADASLLFHHYVIVLGEDSRLPALLFLWEHILYICARRSQVHTHTRRQERSSRTVFCSPLLMVRAGRMVNHKIIYRASRHFLSALNLQLSSPAGFTFYTRPCREIQTKNKERNEICFIQRIFLIRRRSFIK